MCTDSINGYLFKSAGNISNSDLQNFTLKRYGAPLSSMTIPFKVHFDTSFCNFSIPPKTAVYIFNALPKNSPNINATGSYWVGTILNISDIVNVPITVTLPRTYSSKAQLDNGMSFNAKGVFLNGGNTIITLKGSGKPKTKGVSIVSLNVSNQICNFSVIAMLDTAMY